MKYYLTSTIPKMCGNISLKLFAELLTWLADGDFAKENDDYINKIIKEFLSANIEDGENEEEENEKFVVLIL